MKLIVLVFISLFIPFFSMAQLINGDYVGDHAMIKVNIKSDVAGSLSYMIGAGLSVSYQFNIISQGDSTFYFKNYNIIHDRIEVRRGFLRIKKNPKIIFYILNNEGKGLEKKITYQLFVKDTPSKKEKYIRFKYNNKDYCYLVEKRVSKMKIFVDIDNSYFISDWKSNENKLIPYIHGEIVEKWIVINRWPRPVKGFKIKMD